MSTVLACDFETASELNLKKVGSHKYAQHPSTRVLCLSMALDNEEPRVWMPGGRFPEDIAEHISTAKRCTAWNAQFERLIWTHKMPEDITRPTHNQWYCTAAQARANALPGKLEMAAKVLGIPENKDAVGKRLMLRLAKRVGDNDKITLDEMTRLMAYCQQDVRVERAIYRATTQLTDDELYTFLINEHVNDRGVLIDLELVQAAQRHFAEETERLNDELHDLTGGYVEKITQVDRLKAWMRGETGVTFTSLDKHMIRELLKSTLPVKVKRALVLRQEGAKTSVAKYQALEERRMSDGRVRGMFVFAGAGQTGRFSSTGAQLHNLVRESLPDAERAISQVKRFNGRELALLREEPPLHMLSKLVRPALVAPPGKSLVIGDFSSVEAIMLPWLAEEQDEVAAYAAGRDRYVEDAANVFHIEQAAVNEIQRQAGKVIRLACGFGGRKGAVMAMAESYGLEFTEQEADRHAAAWHRANPWVEQFGRKLEFAAMQAVVNPGTLHTVGKLEYQSGYINQIHVLRCRLPSGRVLSYQHVDLEQDNRGGYQLVATKPRGAMRERLWYGILIENPTQAACNDLLRHAMALLHGAGYPVVAHIHDETVEEINENDQKAVSDIQRIMETLPEWATGFPLTAKVHVAQRYSK